MFHLSKSFLRVTGRVVGWSRITQVLTCIAICPVSIDTRRMYIICPSFFRDVFIKVHLPPPFHATKPHSNLAVNIEKI